MRQRREEKDATKSRVWNVEINEEIMARSGAVEILDVVERYYERFNIVNFATALHRIAKSPDGREALGDPRFGRLARTAAGMCADGFSENDPYALVCTLWAFAKLGFRDVELLESISSEFLRQLHEHRDFSTSELAQTAWSFAALLVTH